MLIRTANKAQGWDEEAQMAAKLGLERKGNRWYGTRDRLEQLVAWKKKFYSSDEGE